MEHADRLDHVVDKALRKSRRYHPTKQGIMPNYQPPVNTDVILCLLVDSSGGRSHAVTLWDGWMFDSNLAYAIPLEKNRWTGAAPTMVVEEHSVFVTLGKQSHSQNAKSEERKLLCHCCCAKSTSFWLVLI